MEVQNVDRMIHLLWLKVSLKFKIICPVSSILWMFVVFIWHSTRGSRRTRENKMQIIRNFGCTNCLSCLFSAKYKQNWHFKLEKCWNAKFLLHPTQEPGHSSGHLLQQNNSKLSTFSRLWYFLIKGSRQWQHYIVSFSRNHSILEC